MTVGMDQQFSHITNSAPDPGTEAGDSKDGSSVPSNGASAASQEQMKTKPDQFRDISDQATASTQAKGSEEYPMAKPSQIPDPNSKNQQKKLKRKLEWEEGREARKLIRREKTKAAKQRKREAKHAEAKDTCEIAGQAEESYGRSSTASQSAGAKPKAQPHPQQVPITIILDCQFDSYMTDPERISLGSQLTRCYADNRKTRYRSHLAVSSFGGHLKERFDGILAGVYKNWNGVKFRDMDWIAVAEEAKEWMKDPKRGGRIRGALVGPSNASAEDQSDAKTSSETNGDTETEPTENESRGQESQEAEPQPQLDSPQPEPHDQAPPIDEPKGEIVYLTSDSPNTLTSLKPYSTYVIGGIVDKNRHKGICYKLASEAALQHPAKRITTAKLPIGEYLAMESRKVLTTNHVNEIMLRWLELGDWGAAFMAVIPKRKGGELRPAAAEVRASPAADAVSQQPVE